MLNRSAGGLRHPFYFCVPLIARAASPDWALIDQLFDLTLRSVLAQEDEDFHLVLAGHDVPPAWERLAASDVRFTFLRADWPPEPPPPPTPTAGARNGC